MKTTNKQVLSKIAYNIEIHNEIFSKYEKLHSDIFNEIEQTRLREAMNLAYNAIKTKSSPLTAFDFGCGSGNLTRHLTNLNIQITSADVSVKFLELVKQKFSTSQINTHLLNGKNLDNIEDNSFDLVATYSVLHHIPDYLSAVQDMVRICKPGGIIFIDHERTDEYWTPNETYSRFLKKATKFDFNKYLILNNYIGKIRRLFIDPYYSNEGDIHVWPHDHIEWNLIKDVLLSNKCEIVVEESYLLFKEIYRKEIYENYKNQCSDTKLIIARKK